ncbi:hypothetical protein P5719_011470, partial [Lactobacillus amylovorus]|uniref:hypothetical protein n=1 Tax=Lactobacillus amylovorus TaxID=1604 RepID=UPI00313E233C
VFDIIYAVFSVLHGNILFYLNNYIYDNIEKFNNKPIETEKWIYDKNLIECDDKYYIFRLESNFLSDNEKDTLLTTWRNICHKGHKFIAFCEKPNNPKFDYVKG